MPKRRAANNTNQYYGILHFGKTTVSRAGTSSLTCSHNTLKKKRKKMKLKTLEYLVNFFANKKHGITFKYNNHSDLKRR